MYEIWVRTCSGSEPARCILRAMPVKIPTFPKRKWLLTLWVWVFSTTNEMCYFLKALTSVKVSPESTTSVRVTMTAVGGNTDVSYYD